MSYRQFDDVQLSHNKVGRASPVMCIHVQCTHLLNNGGDVEEWHATHGSAQFNVSTQSVLFYSLLLATKQNADPVWTPNSETRNSQDLLDKNLHHQQQSLHPPPPSLLTICFHLINFPSSTRFCRRHLPHLLM